MRHRRVSAIASVMLAVTAIGLLPAVSAWPATGKESRQRPRGAVENCATQSGADFPGAFTSPHNLVVGPLVLVGAGGTPQFVWDPSATRLPEVPGARQGEAPGDGRAVAEDSPGRRARLRAAPPGREPPLRHASRRDLRRVQERQREQRRRRPVTFWSGGIIALSPRCVPLLVWIDTRRTPRRVVIHFGVADCG